MASLIPPIKNTFTNPPKYTFPLHFLSLFGQDPKKTPIVLVACGSFNPITNSHLRMFAMARDYVRDNLKDFEVIGGYFSPVSDTYKKPGLISAMHRAEMCTLAANESLLRYRWLMVDTWEATQESYQHTAVILDHFDHELNTVLGGRRRKIRVMLLAGEDLYSTMSLLGVWTPTDVEHILGRYGVIIIERHGHDSVRVKAAGYVTKWSNNTYVVPQLIMDCVSSTKVRSLLQKRLSIRQLSPNRVVEYIEEHELYQGDEDTNNSDSDESIDRELLERVDAKIFRMLDKMIIIASVVTLFSTVLCFSCLAK